ncbi:GAF and ANTAR domain-containing protein [Gordonia sp. NPDC003504]
MTTDMTSLITTLVNELRIRSDGAEDVLRAITAAAVGTVPGADEASVTVVTRRQIETPVAVGAGAARCDDIQRELGEGPCVRSAVDDATVSITDMTRDERWPRFAAAAAQAGIASMLCCTLYIDGSDFAALNLHSHSSDAFDAQAQALAEVFAAHCSTTFAAAREKEQLRRALSSRDLIGQAKGMLMERYRIDADAAFYLLAKLSQESNTKLVDVAGGVVAAGPGS